MVFFTFNKGFIVTQNPPHQEEVELKRIRYLPPEGLQFDFIDKSCDIWSFGCILIDIFSKAEPIYKSRPSREEVFNGHDLKIYPNIPNDISGFIKDIINKCLERNYEIRINIEDLIESWNIFFEVYKKNLNKIDITQHSKKEEDTIGNIST